MVNKSQLKDKKILHNNELKSTFNIHGNLQKKKKLCGTIHPLTINSCEADLEETFNCNNKIKKKILEKKNDTTISNEKKEKLNNLKGVYQKIRIPIAFHVIYPKNQKNNSRINILDRILDLQIDALNGNYNPQNTPNLTESYGYKQSKSGYLTEGNTLSGISFYNLNVNGGAYSRTENDDWYYRSEEYESQMKSSLNVDPKKVVNIYISEASGYLGWCHFPYDYPEDNHMHGTVLSNITLPESGDELYGYGRTCIHELGHYFGLYHTFQDGCENNDGCDDTPAQHNGNNIYDCAELNTCNGKGNDPVNNYMNYTDDLCLTHFTDDQFKRVWSCLELYKPNLIKLNTVNENITSNNFTLNKNWNLVSFPFNFEKNSEESLSNTKIYSYNLKNGYINSNNLELGKGYWIRSHDDKDLNFENIKEEIEDKIFNLKVDIGWNLIGCLKYKSNIILNNNLKLDGIYKYLNGKYIDIDIEIDSKSFTLYPYEAYWIRISKINRDDSDNNNYIQIKSI